MRLGAGAVSAQLLFKCRISSAAVLAQTASYPLAAAPGALDLTLTAMTANTLRIGIAPALAFAPEQELGVTDSVWPAPIERLTPARPQSLTWGKYAIQVGLDPLRIAVLEKGKTRQEIRIDTDSTNIHFSLDGPIFGLGEGGHPFDRRGSLEGVINGQDAPDFRTFGARVQIPWVLSPTGWGIFIGQPLGAFEFTQQEGIFRGVEATSTRNVFLLLGDGPAGVLNEYARLTGFPHMPPRWALGYLQSHRTLAGRDEVLGETRTFREKKLPCDAMIYLGTGFCPSGWNTGHGSFTFNENVFPDPEAMLKQIHDDHFKVVLHVVPPDDFHGSVNDTDPVAEEPGDAAPYWQQHAELMKIGVDGWWPDEGDRLSVYARFNRNRMYFEGSRRLNPGRRPYALHRNAYAGLQRFGWLWSGDTSSTWSSLRAQIMVGIGAALSGFTYWGTDIAGFVPTPEFTPELYVRWFQWAAFCPLFRAHGQAWQLRLPWGWNTGDAGPKEVGGEWVANWPAAGDLHRPDVEPICRTYLNLRYQLLPYLYSMVAQGHFTGLPLIRALSIGWPEDERAVMTDDAYMWGDSFLVAPVYQKDAPMRTVYLPAGAWWDFWSGARIEGAGVVSKEIDLKTLPLFVRAGAIVPFGPVLQYSDEMTAEPVTLRIYPGADGRFAWYDDDGTSYKYQSGEFMGVECTWNDARRTLTLALDPNSHMRLPESVRVELADTKQSRLVTLNRNGMTVRF